MLDAATVQSSPAGAAQHGARFLSARDAEYALLPDDEIVVDGIAGRFVQWHQENQQRWLLLRTRVREPRLAGKEATQGSDRTPLYKLEAAEYSRLALASTHLPTFDELTRCTWGTHVTVRGQPAKFNQAGVVDGRQVVIVLAGDNPVLAAESWHWDEIGPGENAYYFEYDHAGLRIGTPPSAPLLREQAATFLRSGDIVVVNGLPATFLEATARADELWLTLRAAPQQKGGLDALGAEQVADHKWGAVWRLNWGSGLQMRLVSARLPTFAELGKLKCGTLVNIGVDAVPGQLQCTQVRDGTKQFVLVKAAPWLNIHQADSRPVPDSREWLYRIRFEEAGLRLAEDGAPQAPAQAIA